MQAISKNLNVKNVKEMGSKPLSMKRKRWNLKNGNGCQELCVCKSGTTQRFLICGFGLAKKFTESLVAGKTHFDV